ncbi:Ribosome assembly protein rrb1 [Mycoemilia scoparia]|uniref:Glutamate-rich WD repeat-containing protein 1 n=1 Tax=Mycoemilia scoparia TaxID=417184 RepID=A0A9W7ZSK0_9FUNG|nr:Ribosome assembly protein rrb1 [Mycoemilia scoparia]
MKRPELSSTDNNNRPIEEVEMDVEEQETQVPKKLQAVGTTSPNKNSATNGKKKSNTIEDQIFEDAWEDEYESENEVSIESDRENETEQNMDMVMDEIEKENNQDPDTAAAEDEEKVYLPGDKLEEGEQLQVDNSAYHMLHSINVNWPCLSFDIIPDNLGTDRTKFPHTMYLFTGTQASQTDKNEVMVMKLSHLHRTINDDKEGSDIEDNDEDLDDDPLLETRTMKQMGGTNRARVYSSPESILGATWSERGKVHIWDISHAIKSLEVPGYIVPQSAQKPLFSVSTHADEGFALDWSRNSARLLSGDFNKLIYLTVPRGNSGFTTDSMPFRGHKSSIEDIQWSPEEQSVFASCSADQTVKLWDIRSPKHRCALDAHVHTDDVNVISWNRRVRYLMASGCEDGSFAVWDLRTWSTNPQTQKPSPVATFKWNAGPVTSIEWDPTDDSVLALSGADDQLTIWDLSVEQDTEQQQQQKQNDKVNVMIGPDGQPRQVPPQLLFIHQGQQNIKELHWHPQIPGSIVSTAATGFNVFKTISV